MTTSKKILGGCFLFLLLSLSGCSIIAMFGEMFSSSDNYVDPKIPVAGKTILVIPFQDDVFTYFDSERGKMLARAIVRDILKNKNFSELKTAFLSKNKDLEQYFQFYKKISWKKIAKLGKADWVVFGKINEFTTHTSTDVSIYRGQGSISFQVYDVKKDKILVTKNLGAKYPKNLEGSIFPTGTSNADIQLKIEGGLLKRLAYLVGREFYTYTKETSPKH